MNIVNTHKSGLVIVNKEKGLTSHDVVNKLRKIYGIKRIGHVGTLDPLAEGVLPACIGKCTRLSSILSLKNKTYMCSLLLGISTVTGDIEGSVKEEVKISETFYEDITSKIPSILDTFKGEYMQKVPLYSAVKVAGKKLYEYARSNEKVSLPYRKVSINNIDYIHQSCYYNEGKICFSFNVSCSKGTYIRSLCEDIGEKLHLPSTMKNLTRVQVGDISLNDSYSLNYIRKNPQRCVIPIDKIDLHMPKVCLPANVVNKLLVGHKLYKNILKENYYGKFAIYSEDYKLIAVFDKSDREYYKNLMTFN